MVSDVKKYSLGICAHLAWRPQSKYTTRIQTLVLKGIVRCESRTCCKSLLIVRVVIRVFIAGQQHHGTDVRSLRSIATRLHSSGRKSLICTLPGEYSGRIAVHRLRHGRLPCTAFASVFSSCYERYKQSKERMKRLQRVQKSERIFSFQ